LFGGEAFHERPGVLDIRHVVMVLGTVTDVLQYNVSFRE